MKLLHAKVQNFGSYDTLDFSFEDQGLALIYGPTGSGKSTLQDISTWILFGITAKNGNVDEIRSWNNPESPTIGVLTVKLGSKTIEVTRIRGKSSQNDLYFKGIEDQDFLCRGKDLTETQQHLEAYLGITPELYLSAACYNEFSPTVAFFTSKSKARRELFEKLANLELSIKLAERTSDERKNTKKIIEERTRVCDTLSGQLKSLLISIKNTTSSANSWDASKIKTIQTLQEKFNKFEEEKQDKLEAIEQLADNWNVDHKNHIKDLTERRNKLINKASKLGDSNCSLCGQPNEEKLKLERDAGYLQYALETAADEVNPYISVHQSTYMLENKYLEQIEIEKNRINPFLTQIEQLCQESNKVEAELFRSKSYLDNLTKRMNALTRLYDLSFVLRGKLLNNTIKLVEQKTNEYLENYFDSEIRVIFDIKKSDDLDVTIYKSGHECAFTQLSKGQRSLLKLCFSVSVMEIASNKAGIHFDTLAFDEALDGLDINLKVKTFRLFEEMSKTHSTVLVIDHSEELKLMFDKHYEVSIESDISLLKEL